jgi:hypothetical protein
LVKAFHTTGVCLIQRFTSARREQRTGDHRTACGSNGNVIVELELCVTPVTLVALVTDGEIERAAATADGVGHQVV